MKTVSAVLVVLVASLMDVTLATTYATCNATMLSSVKSENGGSYPSSILTALKVIWNKDFSIVWYSNYMVQLANVTCVNTQFGIFKTVDSYVNNCNVTKEVTFKSSYNFFRKTFTISDYEEMDLSAYPIYSGRYCLALYVCSSTGVKPPHVTVYCPTDSLTQAETEIEEAKAQLTKFGINDGVALCTETCS